MFVKRGHIPVGRVLSGTRSYSVLVATHLNESVDHLTVSTTSKPTVSTLGDLVKSQPSSIYLKAIKSNDFKIEPPVVSRVAQELQNFAQDQDFDVILRAFLKITSSVQGIEKFKQELSHPQITYFLRLIIEHEKSVIHKFIDLKKSKSKSNIISAANQKCKFYREGIRTIYSQLLFGTGRQSRNHIYDISRRKKFYDEVQDFKLSVGDYENLIIHEIINAKFDLADKWFQRFEDQYDFSLLTPKMWELRFQIASGGPMQKWRVKDSDWFTIKPYQKSKLSIHKSWREVYAEYISLGNARDLKMDEMAMMGMAKDGKLDHIKEFIEQVWGISPTGECKAPIANSSIHYPTIHTLETILVVFAYNHKFFDAMNYINWFQDAYGSETFNLAGSSSISFWKHVFQWADQCTSFDEQRTLKIFLKDLNVESGKNMLERAQQNVDFDYESYRSYVANLKEKRFETMNQLWGLYLGSTKCFSASIFNLRLKICREIGKEKELFEFLERLNEMYHYYSTDKNSFNRQFSPLIVSTAEYIEDIYINGLKELVDKKGLEGYIGQCTPLIEEWSLNRKMVLEMKDWLKLRIPVYRKELESRREEKMIQQRSDDNEESLLNLF